MSPMVAPPPRTATESWWVRAKLTASMTSATPLQRAIGAGRCRACHFESDLPDDMKQLIAKWEKYVEYE